MENTSTEPMTTDVNGTATDESVSVEKLEPAPVTATSYDDLFPSLPSAGPSSGTIAGSGGPTGGWNRKPVLAPSTVTQVFHIPVEERKGQLAAGGFGVDDSMRIIKNVMEKTNAKVEMSTNKDQSLTFLISGKHANVLNARRELLSQFQTQAVVHITIPKDHHRYILGKGGARLQDLEKKTATKISIPKPNDSSDQITISGPKEGIEKAIHEIRITSDEQSKQAYEVLQIPKQFHPFINGPNSDRVKKWMSEYSNVRINIPPPGVMKDELSVAGEREGVLKVVEQIKKFHHDLERKIAVVPVEVRKSQHRYVIGPKGNHINEILAETGVYVEMPSSESTSETIILRGPQDKLGLALTKVYEKANSIVTQDINCPAWLHKYIIGKKGATIQKLTSDFQKVHVEFCDGADIIRIEGAPEEVDKAREVLEVQAKELIRTTDYAEISVDAKYHKHIIGKGGSTVNKIKQETDVVINIPDNDKGSTCIRIEGNKEGVKKAKEELEAMVQRMQNEKDKDLIIESRFHRQLIGPKGESIQKIRDDFATVQISFPDLGSNSDIVKLRGPKDDVDKCARYLTKIYKDLLESNYQVKVPIFKQFHKFIIGKGGSTIKKIRQETDTKVDLPESGSESDVITITGKKENVEKAQAKIQQIQSEMANVVSVDIIVPAKIHNTMIGTGGKLIQSIMDDCGGVSIKFPEANSGSDKVTIRGPKDDVEKAKKMLMEMSNEKQLSNCSAEVRAKPEHHKFLIGRQGANIQSVRDKTGARVIFPGENEPDREVITILGTKESVAQAKKELEARIKDLDNVVEESMTVDPKHHRHFVIKRGEVLRQIGEEFGGVVVSFPRSGVDSDQVALKGAKECIDAARSRIQEIVSNLECQVTIEVSIDQQHHRTIMGTRGSKLQKICADCDVQIKIPDRQRETNGEAPAVNGNHSNDVIKITGRPENCEKAKQALIDMVPINIEVEIPYEFHRFVIGQKGQGVRQLMSDYDVNIKVPPSEAQSNIVTVTGPPPNVEEAKRALLDKLGELEAEKADREAKSFEIKVEVNPEYHPKIIGRKGAVITKLRDDFDVNIQLPKKGSPDESIITITGYESSATAARDAILKIVDDYESMVKEEVEITHKVHSMIIGRKGAGIRKIMSDYRVDIKLPKPGDENPDLVIVSGSDKEKVASCIKHLVCLSEDFMDDVDDWMDDYIKNSSRGDGNQKAAQKNEPKGFHVAKGAPWQGASDEAFPSLGKSGESASATPVWGPRR